MRYLFWQGFCFLFNMLMLTGFCSPTWFQVAFLANRQNHVAHSQVLVLSYLPFLSKTNANRTLQVPGHMARESCAAPIILPFNKVWKQQTWGSHGSVQSARSCPGGWAFVPESGGWLRSAARAEPSTHPELSRRFRHSLAEARKARWGWAQFFGEQTGGLYSIIY